MKSLKMFVIAAVTAVTFTGIANEVSASPAGMYSPHEYNLDYKNTCNSLRDHHYSGYTAASGLYICNYFEV